ncbi:MAG: 23S rRNA (adenine(2030)-N(6))-methyltransferase RlmJ [Alphaproteobacteria bacterium]|jgi:23S rRNA (adenine2030-N6)-methyltransferase
MLSYQHMYHSGSLADVHKHILLARALDELLEEDDPILYVETHSGRGRYNLDSPAAQKTGEAAAGIDRLLREQRIDRREPFMRALKAIQGSNDRLYPGSPLLAAEMMRTDDRMWLWELHPREHGWLERLFGGNDRVTVSKADGLASLPLKAPPKPPMPQQGLVLVDPSYEVKADYDLIPPFVNRLRRAWPAAAGMIWYPMLPALRHEEMRDTLRSEHSDIDVNECVWGPKDQVRGLFGTGVAYWGIGDDVMQNPAFAPFSANG